MVVARAFAQPGSVCASRRKLVGRRLFVCVVHVSVIQSSVRDNLLDRHPVWLCSPVASTLVDTISVLLGRLAGEPKRVLVGSPKLRHAG